jgi:hypothetical protein
MTSQKKKEFIERQARRNDITPRQFCIRQIEEWREHLETVSTDFRELDEESYQKRLDEEILEREQ